jgi:hypothetical protein
VNNQCCDVKGKHNGDSESDRVGPDEDADEGPGARFGLGGGVCLEAAFGAGEVGVTPFATTGESGLEGSVGAVGEAAT